MNKYFPLAEVGITITKPLEWICTFNLHFTASWRISLSAAYTDLWVRECTS